MPVPIPPTADRNKPDLVQSAPPSPKPPWPHHPVSSSVGGIYLRVLRVSGCSSNFGFFASKKGLTLRRPERYKVYGIPENHGSRSSNTNGREKVRENNPYVWSPPRRRRDYAGVRSGARQALRILGMSEPSTHTPSQLRLRVSPHHDNTTSQGAGTQNGGEKCIFLRPVQSEPILDIPEVPHFSFQV